MQKSLVTAAGGSSGSGGGSSPIAEYRSPDDFSVAYLSSITLSGAGFPFTPTSDQLIYIRQVKADNTSATYFNGAGGVTLTYGSNLITVYGAGTPFVSGDTYEVGINGPKRSLDYTLDAQKEVLLNPINQQYQTIDPSVTALPASGVYSYFPANSTSPTNTSAWSMDGYQNLSMTGSWLSVAGAPAGSGMLFVQISNEEIPSATTDWVQIYGTDMVTNTVVNKIYFPNQATLTTYALNYPNLNTKWFRLVASGTSTSTTLNCKMRLAY